MQSGGLEVCLKTVRYNADTAKCPKCGGMLAYDARLTQKLPLGFGFAPGSGRFQVDVLIRKGWRGECMDCGEKVFAVQSERQATRFPSGINRKLKLAQQAEGI